METDQRSYLIGEPIILTLTNTGEKELILPRCGDQVAIAVDKRVGDDWDEHSTRAMYCPAVYLMTPLHLAPEEILREKVVVDEPGTFRFRFLRASDERTEGFASSAVQVTR